MKAYIAFLTFIAYVVAQGNISFLVLGDWGSATSPIYGPSQIQVANAMASIATNTNPLFVVTVGDNFYPDGVSSVTDPQWAENLNIYSGEALQVPWFPALGNHDYYGYIEPQLEYKTDERWVPLGRNYTIQVNASGVLGHIIFLDTSPFIQRYYTNPPNPNMKRELADQHWQDQLAWFNQELDDIRKNGPEDWIFVVGHHPIYCADTTDESAELQQYVLPLFKKYGVAAYYCGHHHDLEHLQDANIDFFISGAGSRVALNGKAEAHFHEDLTPPHPTIKRSISVANLYNQTIPGFVSVELGSDTATTTYYSNQKTVLHTAVTRRPRKIARRL
eukprot:TRINITY_DN90_c0_g2_i1.p1 TRINITY_DN90_c0_g2~~TRINITY_DN90_c0_g2_i1.p1  ORF type:complete len:332 (+),score=77.01 TRINITY_DN90_c0_g2_i1:94-1089(+)